MMQYVKSHVYENISRADAAGMVFLNEEYFSKLFKAETGMTFKDYVLIEKMKMAGTLLKNTNFSVGVIASKVGFDKKMKKSAVPCHESDKGRHFFGGEKKREKIQ